MQHSSHGRVAESNRGSTIYQWGQVCSGPPKMCVLCNQVLAKQPLSQCRSVPEGCRVLTEGKASILQRGEEVFYNPAQVASSGKRALTVAFMSTLLFVALSRKLLQGISSTLTNSLKLSRALFQGVIAAADMSSGDQSGHVSCGTAPLCARAARGARKRQTQATAWAPAQQCASSTT